MDDAGFEQAVAELIWYSTNRGKP